MSPFDPDPYKIIWKKGNSIKIQRNQQILHRNISKVKRINLQKLFDSNNSPKKGDRPRARTPEAQSENMQVPYVLIPNPQLATDVPKSSAEVTIHDKPDQHPRDIPLPSDEEDGMPMPMSENDESSSHISDIPSYPPIQPIINVKKGRILDIRVWEKHLPGKSIRPTRKGRKM